MLDEPGRVQELHRRFVDAGSELILTCTFGASAPRLADGPLAGRAHEVNRRAAELAREAAGAALVAGSLGPTGQLAEPFGVLTRDAAVDAYAEQARGLVDGGVDLLVLETFFALDEALWALEGVRSATDAPLAVSFSFDQGTRTMMGLAAADVVEAFAPLGVAALGANCGRSLADMDSVVDEFLARRLGRAAVGEAERRRAADRRRRRRLRGRCGDARRHVRGYAARGASVVGGCCGSTPEHVAAIARALGR